MTILKPFTESQFEISLESEDKTLSYPSSFRYVNGFSFSFGSFMPIEIKSCYDPVYFKDLIDYCLNLISTPNASRKLFKITVHHAGCNGIHHWEGYHCSAIDCNLVGFNIVKADRDSGECADFSLSFNPGRLIREPRN